MVKRSASLVRAGNFSRAEFEMIYLDVTSSCKCVKNTGMQRMTRGIYNHLSSRVPVTCICWNIKGQCYQVLGRTEMAILRTPFRVRPKPVAKPEWHGETPWAEWHRLVFRKTLRLEDELGSDDVLLIPDFYRDFRTELLPDVIAKTHVQSVAIFHDASALKLPRLSPEMRTGFCNYLTSLAAYRMVICDSRESQDDLLRYWNNHRIGSTATCVEPLPTDFDNTARAPISPNGHKMIACVGSFEPRKNHLTLLGAAERLWARGYNFELKFVGRTTAHYARTMLPAIWRLQRRVRPVRWLRHVSDEKLHEEYRSCRFTVYPSLFEGFGLPIMESLWHGKPCICGGNGALGEVARDGGCLIVNQTSEEALAAGIEKLLMDEGLYAQLCAQARTRRFRSWPDYIDRLLEHLRAPERTEPITSLQPEG